MATIAHAPADAPTAEKAVEVSRTAIMSALFALWAALIGANIVQDVLTASGAITDRIWMLDVEVESGFYTWFSTLLLAGAGLVCGLVALEQHAARGRLRLHWGVLAITFLALSADEACSIHEALSGPLTAGLSTSGMLHFAWVIPAMIACAVGLIMFIPFIMSFPQPLRTRLLVSAAAFLTGAIGMEMVAGEMGAAEQDVLFSPAYRMLATIEEALEGGAVILFIRVILAYRRTLSDRITLRLV